MKKAKPISVQLLVPLDTIRYIGLAARKWARDNPDDPNAQRIVDAVNSLYPSSKWIATDKPESDS